MTAKELIRWLTSAIAEHGDLEIGCMNPEYGDSHIAEFEVVDWNKSKETERKLVPKFIRVS